MSDLVVLFFLCCITLALMLYAHVALINGWY